MKTNGDKVFPVHFRTYQSNESESVAQLRKASIPAASAERTNQTEVAFHNRITNVLRPKDQPSCNPGTLNWEIEQSFIYQRSKMESLNEKSVK
jgi:hypothetical protein